MLLPIHLYFLATVRSTSKRTLLLVSFLLCFAGLYFTYTRGAWLAGVAALGTTVFLNRRHYLRMVMPALIVVPLLGIFFLGIGQDTFMKERVGNEHTISSRLGTAVTALRMWKANPLLGVGFFQFRHLQKEYVQPVDIPLMGSVKYSEMLLVPIHDIYLGPLAEDGLVGALLQGSIYLFILLAFLKKYKKREKNDHFATYILPIFGGLWIGYLVGGLAIDYRFFSIVGALFYMFAGITVGLDSDEDQGMEEFEDEVRGSGRQME
ncbi:MAG: O-antigen ligase family protein [Gemmatimonadales bacterium]|nr:O-antigen ligase family protein [Gemmatimonadales bacterium]